MPAFSTWGFLLICAADTNSWDQNVVEVQCPAPVWTIFSAERRREQEREEVVSPLVLSCWSVGGKTLLCTVWFSEIFSGELHFSYVYKPNFRAISKATLTKCDSTYIPLQDLIKPFGSVTHSITFDRDFYWIIWGLVLLSSQLLFGSLPRLAAVLN